ncbi:TPA: hypothetical protein ACH3X1_015531 [Trebouxia sp. C0004]
MTTPSAAAFSPRSVTHRATEVCQLNPTCSTSYTEAHDKFQSDPEAVETVTVSTHGAIDPYRFNMFMSDLLAERGSDIKQMHGTLSIQGYGNHGTYFKFEGAQNSVRFGPTAGMVGSDIDQACASQVTFSGHSLLAKDLQEALDSCAWLPVAPGWTEHIAPGYHQPFYFHQATGRKQWQRPAVVEAQPASPFRVHPQSPVTIAGNSSAAGLSRPSSYASELSDHSLENASVRTRQQPKTAATRSAVSCPCDASDACTAVFDISCRKEVRSAKRTCDEDVTSKFADLDVHEKCMALFDSASELESAQGEQGKRQQRKASSAEHLQQNVQQVKAGLWRSNSCPWTPKQIEYCTQLAAFGH